MSIEPSPLITWIGAFLLGPLGYLAISMIRGGFMANGETSKIYEGLNDALKEQNASQEQAMIEMKTVHETEIGKLRSQVGDLETRLTKAEDSLAFYERIFKDALKEYFESHPEVTNTLPRGRRATDKT